MDHIFHYTIVTQKVLDNQACNHLLQYFISTFELTIEDGFTKKDRNFRRALERIVDYNNERATNGIKTLPKSTIAKILNVSEAAIRREFSKCPASYKADIAQRVTDQKMLDRKPKPSKLTEEIERIIRDGYMDQRFAYELTFDPTLVKSNVSEGDIYYWIYSGKIADLELTGKPKKARNKRLKEEKLSFSITRSFKDRDPNILLNNEFGHWEVDTIYPPRDYTPADQGKVGSQVIATIVERKTRFVLAVKMPNRTKSSMFKCIKQLKNILPKYALKTITVDRGSEFACCKEIEEELGIPVYVTDAKSPEQKPYIENRNGAIRRFIKKEEYFEYVPNDYIEKVLERLAKKPMKTIRGQRAATMFKTYCKSRNPFNLIKKMVYGVFKNLDK